MISRCRAETTLFRHTAKGREALAPSGEMANHAHYTPTKAIGIGSVTSRSKETATFWERLAWELAGAGDPAKALVPGCTVAQARQLHAEGLIK